LMVSDWSSTTTFSTSSRTSFARSPGESLSAAARRGARHGPEFGSKIGSHRTLTGWNDDDRLIETSFHSEAIAYGQTETEE
jgi:hypothetical protein